MKKELTDVQLAGKRRQRLLILVQAWVTANRPDVLEAAKIQANKEYPARYRRVVVMPDSLKALK